MNGVVLTEEEARKIARIEKERVEQRIIEEKFFGNRRRFEEVRYSFLFKLHQRAGLPPPP